MTADYRPIDPGEKFGPFTKQTASKIIAEMHGYASKAPVFAFDAGARRGR